MSIPSATVVSDLEFFVEDFDPKRITEVFQEHGCCVVRGLAKHFVDAIQADIERIAAESLAQLDHAVPMA